MLVMQTVLILIKYIAGSIQILKAKSDYIVAVSMPGMIFWELNPIIGRRLMLKGYLQNIFQRIFT